MSAASNAPEPKQLHPFCSSCGWRKGGIDSWNGSACKCGHTEPALPMIGFTELLDGPEAAALEALRNSYRTSCAQRDLLLAALRKIKSDTRVDDPLDHYDLVCEAIAEVEGGAT